MIRNAMKNLLFVTATMLCAAALVVGARAAGVSLSMVCPWYLAVIPVAGIFGWGASFIAYTLLLGVRLLRVGYLSTYGLPTLCAGLYFERSLWLVRVVLPLTCMALFMAHPVGYAAAWYSMYWIIPVAIAFMRPRYFFVEALGSTFTAHAVGSVISLYTVQHTAQYWLILIPVVPFERIIAASLATAAYMVFCAARSMMSAKTPAVPTTTGCCASH